MIIDLDKKRDEYFLDLDAAEITRKVTGEEGRFVTASGLRKFAGEGKLVIGTAEGDLEQLLSGTGYLLDSLALAAKIDELPPDKLLVLPPGYRIPAEEARDAVVYSRKTIVNLDSANVKRMILGEEAKPGRLSGKKKQEFEWEPEKALAAAFEYLHQHKDTLAERAYSCYGWHDKTGRLRVVPLIRAIQGAELRMFQNLAALKLIPLRLRRKIRGVRFAHDKSEITGEQIEAFVKRIERYKKIVKQRGLEKAVGSLDVSGWDLMKTRGEPFNYETGHYVRVPSLTRPEELFQGEKIIRRAYSTILLNVPLFARNDPAAYSAVWDLEGLCECRDFQYRSLRRKNSAQKGMPDVLFCKHLVGAAWDLMSIYKRKEDRTIPFLPFVLPTEGMARYTDRLRYQTIILEPTEHGGWTKRALNHTEMERHIWDRVKLLGSAECFSTSPERLAEKGEDILTYLLRFRDARPGNTG